MTGPRLTCPECGDDNIGSSLEVPLDVWYNQVTGRWEADIDTIKQTLDGIADEMSHRANGPERPTHFECDECGHDWTVEIPDQGLTP